MSLHTYLTRLIWLCMLPLVLLAVYLAIDSVRTIQLHKDHEAINLAENFATAIDQNLSARIAALQILAMSPHADDASDWKDLYREAQNFHENFHSHVILADRDMRMVFNTRVPFGTPLPLLPRPKGHAAAPAALQTGKPAVGDIFIGPIANEPLIAIAVPGLREGRTAFLILTTFETGLYQKRLDQVALPAGWSLDLLDGSGEAIARRAPAELKSVTDVDAAQRYTFKSAVSPWSVVLAIPRVTYRAPLLAAAAALASTVLGATLVGALGGQLASRWLGRSVASLAEMPRHDAAPLRITEFAAVRSALAEAAKKRNVAESASRESEQRFRATFEQAAVGIAMIAPDGRWLMANKKLCDMLGYGHDELLTRTFQDITHADDLSADLAYVREMLSGNIASYAMEKRYLTKGGAIVWVRLTVALVRRRDGSPDYFISVIQDIQRRKVAEAALVASETRLNFALEKSQIGAWELDLTDHTANRTLIHDRIFGYPALLPDWTYEIFLEHVVPGDRAEVDRKFRAAIADRSDWNFECRIRRADGAARWIWAAGGHEKNLDGKFIRMSGVVQDITERKKTEEEIHRLNTELEQRVVERTAELTAANRELESFSYSVSHDLRAPLRSIDGFSRALEEDYAARLDDEGRDALQRVRAAAQKMGDLIDDLLNLSRMVRSDMNVQAVDLSTLAGAIAGELKQREPGRNVTFEIAPRLEARGDKRLLVVLLENLLGNAWKFTARHACAHIEFGVTDRDGTPVYFVRDDGAGFDMTRATNLFAPFQRLHSVSDFPGTGIGLATVRRIVQRHGGRVWAEGATDKGAVFYFTLTA